MYIYICDTYTYLYRHAIGIFVMHCSARTAFLKFQNGEAEFIVNSYGRAEQVAGLLCLRLCCLMHMISLLHKMQSLSNQQATERQFIYSPKQQY